MDESFFDAIVTDFYKAATGAMPWDRALDKVQVAFNARTAALHSFDLNNGRMLGLHCGGPDISGAMLTYIRDYHEEDPRRLHALQRGPAGFGQWTHDHEVFDESYVANNHFYQNWLPAYDMRYNANVVIGVGDSVATGFILELHKSRGPLNADEREMARRLG